jgi:NAD(P)-dependent dehydrogenase (short-subunit alcohol dehydrogenase family)
MAREGAKVFAADIDEAGLAKLKAENKAIETLTLDVTDAAKVKSAREQTGPVDVLVNCSGFVHQGTVMEVSEKDWDFSFDLNVRAHFRMIQAYRPAMLERGAGSIVNFASVNAFRGSGTFGMVAHCAGKSAVLGLTRQLAVEGGPLGIRANTISPGMVRTPATESAGAHDGAAREALLARIPLGRVGTPEDIAWCAVYLASDESAWVTGGNFPVDGGVLAK